MPSIQFNDAEVRTPIMRMAVTVLIIVATAVLSIVQPLFWLFGFRGPVWIEDRCLRVNAEGSFKRK